MTRPNSDFESAEQMLERYFDATRPPVIEDRAILHPARLDAFPDSRRNAHGYRSDEFTQRAKLNIAFIGCSWTEGDGVARQEIFPDLVKLHLSDALGVSVNSWNFGQSATGMDYAARILPAVCALRPDIVVLVLSGPDRREFFSADGKRMVFSNSLANLLRRNPGALDNDLACDPGVIRGFGALQSPHQDLANYILGARAITNQLALARIDWLYSCVDAPAAVKMMQMARDFGALPMEKDLTHIFEKRDRASDTNPHPGIESHARFATLLSAAILDRLPRRDTQGGSRPGLAHRIGGFFGSRATGAGRSTPGATTQEDDDIYPLW